MKGFLDYEIIFFYFLMIRVMDGGGLFSIVLVIIIMGNVDDNFFECLEFYL